MRLIKAPPANGEEVGAELPDQVEAWLAKGKRMTARILRDKFRCRHLDAGCFPAELTFAINNNLLDSALRGQTQHTHATRDDERLLRGTERCEASSAGGIESAPRLLAEAIRRRPEKRGQGEQIHRHDASPEGRHHVVGMQEGEVFCKDHGSSTLTPTENPLGSKLASAASKAPTAARCARALLSSTAATV